MHLPQQGPQKSKKALQHNETNKKKPSKTKNT